MATITAHLVEKEEIYFSRGLEKFREYSERPSYIFNVYFSKEFTFLMARLIEIIVVTRPTRIQGYTASSTLKLRRT